MDKVKELVEKHHVMVDKSDYDFRTPLHLAAAGGQEEVVRYLISKGANVNIEDRFKHTPLGDALRGRHQGVVSILKEEGAKITRDQFSTLIEQMCNAAATGDMKLLKLFCETGLNPSESDYDARTPLHLAASNGNPEVVQYLLEAGAKVNKPDRYFNTPLQDALRGGTENHKEVVRLLETHGGQLDTTGIFYESLLEESLKSSMRIICERNSFEVGHMYIPTAGDKEFVFKGEYSVSYLHVDPRVEKMAAKEVFFNKHDHILGKAFDSKSIQSDKMVKEMWEKRYRYYKAAGLNTCCVIPVFKSAKKKKVVALLAFFNDTASTFTKEEANTLLEFTNTLVRIGIYRDDGIITTTNYPCAPKGQFLEVFAELMKHTIFSANVVYHELDWFYNIGFQRYYFERFGVKQIALHLHSFIAAKKIAATSGHPDRVWLHIENNEKLLGKGEPQRALYMVPNSPVHILAVERNLTRLIEQTDPNVPYTLEEFRSERPLNPYGNYGLDMYILLTSEYVDEKYVGTDETDINKVASKAFLASKNEAAKNRYQTILNEAIDSLSPVFKVLPAHAVDNTIPMQVAFRRGSKYKSYLVQFTELLKKTDLKYHRKFVENFANNVTVYTFYLDPLSKMENMTEVFKQFSMLFLVPETSQLTPAFLEGNITASQYTYSSAASRFVYYFLNQPSDEYRSLLESLQSDQLNTGRLRTLHTNLKREAVPLSRIFDTCIKYPEIMKKIYRHFKTKTWRFDANTDNFEELTHLVGRNVASTLDTQILQVFLQFNNSVKRTNFRKRNKCSLSFRLEPSVFTQGDWPVVPFAIYFVMGKDWQGFHIRFSDVARGGIRLIMSNSASAYAKNISTLYAENYNLAFTQNKKNKDIPEFGSKGTILVDPLQNPDPITCFKQYTTGLLDLLIEDTEVTDNLKQEELLFLGPDEGTADCMEWAALESKRRGYAYWKALTTGKPPTLGGIPHDTYGMTTRSVHQYVLGIIDKLGLEEEKLTKFQTGGPDGDLGSNEILLSKDRTTSIVDGSGVLHDPEGLNREELIRLATGRLTVENFDKKKLSKEGFLIGIKEVDVVLPDGETVESGLAFRNNFHLEPRAKADLFVPCGGRPESINLGNVEALFDEKENPNFRFIVEGANLFLTQDARNVLESRGVVLYKDASTNKGGVTSSSLEVLAALSTNDSEFARHLQVKENGEKPEFYGKYVAEIIERIERAARDEFECLWKEHERTGTPRYLLTDQISDKINELALTIRQTPLFDDKQMRNAVLEKAIPLSLQDFLGLDVILQRVPDEYIKSIFASYLASSFVYKNGIQSSEYAFYQHLKQFETKKTGTSNDDNDDVHGYKKLKKLSNNMLNYMS